MIFEYDDLSIDFETKMFVYKYNSVKTGEALDECPRSPTLEDFDFLKKKIIFVRATRAIFRY